MDAWPRIADGSITTTFRTWTRAQAKAGGRYRVGGMLLEASSVDRVPVADLTDDDARSAGEAGREALLKRLGNPGADALVWRVAFSYLGPDDRVALRESAASGGAEVERLRIRLDRLDARSPGGAWTRAVLALIRDNPGVVSTALAARHGQERLAFKQDVRKLKELGLTESLDVGYRLSPRGESLLRELPGA